MAVLHLDPAEVVTDNRPLFDEMQRRCLLCNSRDRCKHDLSTDPQDSRWKVYCANREPLYHLSQGGTREKD